MLVLNYCWNVLRQACPKKDDEEEINEEENDEMANRFETLALGEESDEEDEEEEDTPRPQEPPKAYSLDDILSFPDTAQANQFLDVITYHTAHAIELFRNLKETMRMVGRGEFESSKVPRELVAVGVMINMAIAHVKHLEDSLAIECPHLNSPYRILACAFLAPAINIVKNSIRDYSPVARKFSDNMALAFVADVVEVVFRGQNIDTEVPKLASQFSRRWKLPEHWTMKTNWFAGIIARMVLKESLTEFEKQIITEISLGELSDSEPEPWFTGFEECTGGDRSIVNTLKLLDLYRSWTHDMDSPEHLLNTLPWNFNEWNETSNPASKIRGDMDGIIVKCFLPLIDTWRFHHDPVPREKELLPLVSLIRTWSQDLVDTPLSVAFSFHLIVTSIFEIQGNGDIESIARIAKSAFEEQFLNQCQQQMGSSVPSPNLRKAFLKQILETKKLTEEASDVLKDPEDSLMVFWNPVCASMFLTYTTLGSSIEGGGRCMMNDCNQTLMVLHLYNALKQKGLVDEDLPLVSTIDEHFGQVKRIWNGWAKPEPGKFVYRFMLGMGSDHSFASYRQEAMRHEILGGDKPEKPNTSVHEMFFKSRNR